MDNNAENNNSEFEILGHRVRFNDADKTDKCFTSQDVLELVRSEANKLLETNPSLDQKQLTLLTCLSMAENLLELRNDYKDNIQKLKSSAVDALNFIEEATTHN